MAARRLGSSQTETPAPWVHTAKHESQLKTRIPEAELMYVMGRIFFLSWLPDCSTGELNCKPDSICGHLLSTDQRDSSYHVRRRNCLTLSAVVALAAIVSTVEGG